MSCSNRRGRKEEEMESKQRRAAGQPDGHGTVGWGGEGRRGGQSKTCTYETVAAGISKALHTV